MQLFGTRGAKMMQSQYESHAEDVSPDMKSRDSTAASIIFLLLLYVMFVFCPVVFALAETDKYEKQILQSWKATAKTTQIGNQLLRLLEATDRTLLFDPKDKQSLYRRGYLLGTVGCTSGAIADLSKLVQSDPYFGAAYKERGLCYLDQKDYNRALQDLNRACILDPKSGDALLARGRIYLLLHQPNLALRDFRACKMSGIKFQPALPGELPANHYDALDYYTGTAYESLNRSSDAIRCYKESIKSPHLGITGYIHRYADQPLDASWRIKNLESE